MARIKLTNQRIENANVAGQKSRTGKEVNQIFLWDTEARGLAARVTIAGVKSFIFQGKIGTETIRSTIGKTASWTIEDARKEARRLQQLLDRGIDPRVQEEAKKTEKAEKKAAIEAMEKYTLKNLLSAYTDHLMAKNKTKSSKAAISTIKVHVLEIDPILSDKPAKDVTAVEIASLIRKAVEKGKVRTPGLLRSIIGAAYNCALRAPLDASLPTSFIGFNIVINPVSAIPTIPINAGNRTLSKDELKGYIAALGNTTTDLALKLALFAGGQRMAMLTRATVTDWDSDNSILRLWDIKGKRKMPREHLLPLGPVATSIVKELIKMAKVKDTALLFPSRNNKTPLHESTPGPRVSEIAATIGGDTFSLLDLRRTVETMLASLGASRDIRAQLLSHGLSGVQQQHYDRYDYMNEKRTILATWEKFLIKLQKSR